MSLKASDHLCRSCGISISRKPFLDDLSCFGSFANYLNTNEPLPETEATRLRHTVLKDMSDEMTRLNSEMERVRSLMGEIEKKRELLQTRIKRYTALISPVRRLPPEILAEIFGWVLESNHWPLFLKLNKGPWLLGRICSQWRHVINSTPRLWTTFRIVYGMESSANCCPIGAVELLKTAISRCGTNTISFNLELDIDSDDDAGGIDLLQELILHSDRWKTAEFYNFDPELLPLLVPIRGHLSSLETLAFDSSPYGIDPDLVDPLSAFEIAPMLREVQRNNVGFHMTLPLNQLTRYKDGWGDSAEEYSEGSALNRLHILEECPNLLHLEFIHGLPDDTARTHTNLPIQHLSLRTLHGCDDLFFDSLILPSLEELKIKTKDDLSVRCPPKVYIAVRALLQRSACPLQKLSLLDIVDIPVVIDILHSCPALSHLTLSFGFWHKQMDTRLGPLIHRLKATSSHDTLLPRLECLKIKIQHEHPTTICIINSAFCDFLESRWNVAENAMVTRLQKFYFFALSPVELSAHHPNQHNADPHPHTVIPRLIALRNGGLDLSIVTVGEFPGSNRFHYPFSERL
ncbi:hypothetical protein EDD85DRAFT_260118 [Armillaria nabsnona]|nr:hypothetical protein EDD85DRAFT_260118 [Armillaria nabsnona]